MVARGLDPSAAPLPSLRGLLLLLLLAATVFLGTVLTRRSRAGAQGRWPRLALPAAARKERGENREREEALVESRALLVGGQGAEGRKERKKEK